MGSDWIDLFVRSCLEKDFQACLCFFSQVKKNNPNPNFEESFVFLLDGFKPALIQIKDENSEKLFGTLQLNMEEILENPIKRKIMSVNEENPLITVNFSAKIDSC